MSAKRLPKLDPKRSVTLEVWRVEGGLLQWAAWGADGQQTISEPDLPQLAINRAMSFLDKCL
jgi:hypothetical protein